MLKIRNLFKYFSTTKRPVMTPGNTPAARKRRVTIRKVGLIGMTVFLITLIYSKNKTGKIQYLMISNQLNSKLLKRNPQLDKQKYIPTIYLPFAILQQLFAKYIESSKFIKQTQQNYEGCTIHYIPIHNQIKNVDIAPCIVVVGGSQGFNQLVTDIMLIGSANKFQMIGVSMNDFHDHQKLANIVTKLKQQRKNRNFYGVGIQYGANLLVVTQAKHPSLFESIVSLGNPLDLNIAQKNVQKSWSAKQTFLQDMIKNRIRLSKLNLLPQTNLYDLDAAIYNLKTEQEINKWKQTRSSINYLKYLKVPTLLLNSKQDSFSIDLTDERRIQDSHLTMFVLTEGGGHNQWFYTMKAQRWAPKVTVSHFKCVQKLLENDKKISTNLL